MTQGRNAPIIVKRRKVVVASGHHGGAWKVAYADFVTAMMAFFLLMWLLNATTEKQRKGIADYFSPTVPVNRVSGGGDGNFGGDSVFTTEMLARVGSGGAQGDQALRNSDPGTDLAGAEPEVVEGKEARALRDLADRLTARSGEAMLSEQMQRHIVTRLTDEGLIVEVFDLDDAPLFQPGSAVPRPILRQIATAIADVFAVVPNAVSVAGHVRARPVVLVDNPNWTLSTRRAHAMRHLIEEAGLAPARLVRVTGHADRKPAVTPPIATRNNRLELVLLRSDIPE
ncbi:flagellar motor protein MotB [Rhodovulum adriaticum]|uniref:Chemotaxis protein MotB n=1 Tax=Rhodovulum adriaticum TaxID=35804 RepID=A0A4V2SMK6_RHOAD|nr:flagellar motor protein MotB [Rhodovulum adriaticum]MBK1634789.1 chemotaxis protein MotB [Rhodovulum adriaticum]TCP27636.1 chemotaxis protein MotB [Rhodovulum adriaticum]